MSYFVGWKYGVLIGGFVGSILLASYPIIISPMINPEKWSMSLLKVCCIFFKWNVFLFTEMIQEETRKNIRQEDVQPGSKYSYKLYAMFTYSPSHKN